DTSCYCGLIPIMAFVRTFACWLAITVAVIVFLLRGFQSGLSGDPIEKTLQIFDVFSVLASIWPDQPGCHSCEFRNATLACQYQNYPIQRSPVQLLHPPLLAPGSCGCGRKRSDTAHCD